MISEKKKQSNFLNIKKVMFICFELNNEVIISSWLFL